MMLLAMTLLQGAFAVNINWLAGFTDPSAQTIQVPAGEMLTFTWTNTHNVYEMPNAASITGACDFSGATPKGSSSGTVVIIPFTANVGDKFYYACEIVGHCGAGQHLTVEIIEDTSTDSDPCGDSCTMNQYCNINTAVCVTCPSDISDCGALSDPFVSIVCSASCMFSGGGGIPGAGAGSCGTSTCSSGTYCNSNAQNLQCVACPSDVIQCGNLAQPAEQFSCSMTCAAGSLPGACSPACGSNQFCNFDGSENGGIDPSFCETCPSSDHSCEAMGLPTLGLSDCMMECGGGGADFSQCLSQKAACDANTQCASLIAMGQPNEAQCNQNSQCAALFTCMDAAGQTNDYPNCQMCTGAAMYNCNQYDNQVDCQGAGGTQAFPHCYWRGEAGVFYGPGCSGEDSTCHPCSKVSNVDGSVEKTALCSAALDERSCDAQAIPQSGWQCVWKGYHWGKGCPGDDDLNEVAKAFATWIILVIVISLLCMFGIICIVAVFCCGLTICCLSASKDKGTSGGVNSV